MRVPWFPSLWHYVRYRNTVMPYRPLAPTDLCRDDGARWVTMFLLRKTKKGTSFK